MTEHDHQKALIKWARYNEQRHPALQLLFAVPNAGKRSRAVAGRMIAEGLKAGVPDLCLPFPSGQYHGLFIEMKVGRNKPTANQVRWIEDLRSAGHRVEVCFSWDQAKDVIEDYLGIVREAA